MRCAKCGMDNAAGARFCNQCATPLSWACPKCAHLNAPDAKFCAECAEALTSNELKSTARTSSTSSVRIASDQTVADVVDGERKTVTALFADIKGSTELEQDLDPEEARAIVDPALKTDVRCGAALRRLRGAIDRRRRLRTVRRAEPTTIRIHPWSDIRSQGVSTVTGWRRGVDSNPRDPSGFERNNSTRVWRTIRPE